MSPVNKKTSERLKFLYRDGDFSKIFDYLASRSNNARETKLDRLAWITGLDRSKVTAFLRALQELELGRFLVGRKGYPSRFEWTVALISVGQVASGESDEILTDDLVDGADDDMELTADQVTYEVPLRPDVKANLTLPANITRVETIRIANFVRGLAVDVTEEGGR